MKFNINSNEFYTAVKTAAKFVSKNSEYTGILIKSFKDNIQITGFIQNGEITAMIKCNAKVESEGEVILPGKFTSNMLKDLPVGEITVMDDGVDGVAITYGTGNSICIKKMDNQDMTAIPLMKVGKTVCSLKINNMSKLISTGLSAIHEVPANANNAWIDTLCFDVREGKKDVVSSDTKSLHRQVIQGDIEGDGRYLVPSVFLQECIELLRISTDRPSLIFTDDYKVVFKCNKGELIGCLVKTNYPDWRMIYPEGGEKGKEFEKKVKTQAIIRNSKMLTDILGRAQTCSDNENSSTLLVFKENRLVIVHTSKNGKLQEDMPIESYGEQIGVVVNIKKFFDSIKQFDGSFVMAITDNNTPIISHELNVKNSESKMILGDLIVISIPLGHHGNYSLIEKEIIATAIQPTLNFSQEETKESSLIQQSETDATEKIAS